MILYKLLSTTYPLILWFFLFGTAIGSFLNVVILRHESEKSITGRSECPHCHKQLTWRELIPVFSYLAQRGKCAGCCVRISPQYPLVEFGTGVLFVAVFFHVVLSSPTSHNQLLTLYNLSPIIYAQLLLELCVWSLLVVITVYDFRTKLIPDVFSYSFAALVFILMFVTFYAQSIPIHYALPPTASLLAGPLLFLPFYLLWKVSDGRWMGLGDGKLALGIGWFLGLEDGGSAIMFSFWIGAVVALVIMGFERIRMHIRSHYYSSSSQSTTPILGMKSEIPFGPFMVVATLLVYLTGASIFSIFPI